MSSMKHTKSPSGKTHRLTDRKGVHVTLRYRSRPDFDDQVQGDLVRKYREQTGSAEPVGVLPVYVDAALLDRGQQQPSLDYLRGYLEGLENSPSSAPAAARMIQNTRAEIARLEASQRGYMTAPIVPGIGGPVQGGPPPAGGVAAGAAAMQVNVVEQPPMNRLDAGVRRVREAERNGW